MLSACGKHGWIIAWDATHHDGPFLCPGCRQEVILKKGYVNVHHFAHKPGVECPYSDYHQGESSLHLLAKKEIYNALQAHPRVLRLQLERYMGPVRPDISFFFGDIPVAIEMQISTIPPDTVARRTREYTRRGIALLWIFPYDKEIVQDGKACNIRYWERYIHSLYQGTVYYWTSGEMLSPVHLEEYVNKNSSSLLSSGLQIASIQPPLAITQLEATYFCSAFADDSVQRAVKF
jgi:competence protein CoiA